MTYLELLGAITEREQRGVTTARAYMTVADTEELRASLAPFGGEVDIPATGYFGEVASVEIIQVAPGEAFFE